MHTVWKGSISFGLVNIPIRMFTATEERDIRFRQLHKECHTPIKYAKTCPHCDREIDSSEIIRGFEYEKGNFVIIQDEDLEKITPETRRAIEILDFVDLSEIDPIYFDKTYYLAPQDTGEKAYALLRSAMESTGKIAIAQITLRNRQSLAAIRIHDHCIVMETIYYPDEVRPVSQVPALPNAEMTLSENELKMAEELITNMSAPFDPAKYTDEYRTELQQLIQKKLEGKEVTVAPAAPKANVIDLMQALKESLAATADNVGTPVKVETEATPEKPAAGRKRAAETESGAAPKTKRKTTASKPSISAILSEEPSDTGATTTTKKLRRKKAQG